MMAAVNGFFNNAPAKENKLEKASLYIDVGGEPFHALATALVDCFKSSSRANEAAIKIILEQFYTFYPKYRISQPYLTPSERILMLVKNIRASELIECLSNVLRHITVDELYANPLNYREVFEGLSADTSKDYFRQPTTKLPLSAFNALSKALDLTIHFSIIEPGKELRKKVVFSSGDPEVSKFAVCIQVQGETYFPQVTNKQDFTFVGHLAVRLPKSIALATHEEETLVDILHIIAEDNKRLTDLFGQHCRTLFSMVSAGELSKEQLINLYIEFLPIQVGNSANSSLLFAGSEQVNKSPINGYSGLEIEQQMVKLLTHTIATWLTTGQINNDQFFNRIEGLETKPVSSLAG